MNIKRKLRHAQIDPVGGNLQTPHHFLHSAENLLKLAAGKKDPLRNS